MIRKYLERDFLSRDDLAMLYRVFDAVCGQTDKTSPTADEDARLVVGVFQSGFRTEEALMAEIRRRQSLRRRHTAASTRE
jgi:hypothetical protein